MSQETETSMTEEEIAFSEIIGDLVEQLGFKRHLGRIWSLIFLRPEPVSPTDIQTELSLSAGTVSSALAELQTWGVVKRIRIAADRNFYYEADVQIWRSVSNVLRTRELRILEEASAGLAGLATSLEKRSSANASFQIKRVKHVRESVDTATLLFTHLVSPSPLNLVKMNKLFQRLKNINL